MQPCCEAMRALLDGRGQSGFSAEVDVSGGKRLLLIRFASYGDEGADETVRLLKQAPRELSLKLGGELVIRRCPWCGYSTKKMIYDIKKGWFRRMLDGAERKLA